LYEPPNVSAVKAIERIYIRKTMSQRNGVGAFPFISEHLSMVMDVSCDGGDGDSICISTSADGTTAW